MYYDCILSRCIGYKYNEYTNFLLVDNRITYSKIINACYDISDDILISLMTDIRAHLLNYIDKIDFNSNEMDGDVYLIRFALNHEQY